MIIIKFCGGLGNQMFQYALSEKFKYLGRRVKWDLSFYKNRKNPTYELFNVFKIKKNSASLKEILSLRESRIFLRKYRRFFKIFWKKTDVQQIYFDFNEEIFKLENAYLEGYWQSEKFFLGIENKIKKNFSFHKIDSKNKSFLKKFKGRNLVSIHIRRGDYENNPSAKKFHGNIATKEYYSKAINYILTNVEDPFFLIFSNDVPWITQEFSNLKNKEIVSFNQGKKSYLDMFLMSKCNHNIIANSSFSWWAAYLNNNPKKIVLCPRKWVNNKRLDSSDIIPPNWIRI